MLSSKEIDLSAFPSTLVQIPNICSYIRLYSVSSFGGQNRSKYGNCFFREIDRSHIIKCKQIANFTRFSENRGKTCEIKQE